MLTKNEFLTEFNGHGNAYSSFMVMGVTLDALIDVLNELNPDMTVGSGAVNEDTQSIYFEICKESPDLIYTITNKLKCRGFADMDCWYGEPCFIAAENGDDYDDFTADWTDGNPDRRDYDYPDYDYDDEDNDPDIDMDWDAFFDVKDNKYGAIFHTGFGAIASDIKDSLESIVYKH